MKKIGDTRDLEIATGFEIRTLRAHEFASVILEACPAVWTGAFDLFDFVGRITGAGRHAVCRLAVPSRNNPPDGQGS